MWLVLQLVLHHVSTKTEYVSALAGADLRRWLPGQQQKLQFSMTLPTNAPLGNYQVGACYVIIPK